MPRPNLKRAVEKIDAPTFEEEVRATANWIRSRCLSPLPNLPVSLVQLDPMFAGWIANCLDGYADMMEGGE